MEKRKVIESLWRGDYGLKVMFWGWFIGGQVVVIAFFLLIGVAFFSNLSGPILEPAVSSILGVAVVLAVLAILLFVYFLVVSVGVIWEAIRNFDRYKGWSIAAILVVLLMWFSPPWHFNLNF